MKYYLLIIGFFMAHRAFAQDYKPICGFTYQNLEADIIKDSQEIMGNQSLEYAALHISPAVRRRHLCIKLAIKPGQDRKDAFNIPVREPADNHSDDTSQFSIHKDYKPLLQFNGDTSAYLLYNFVSHPEHYVDKPLNELLNQLEVPVKRVTPLTNLNEGPNGCYGIMLSFYSQDVIDKKIMNKQEPAILLITWKDLLPREPAVDLPLLKMSLDKVFALYKSWDVVVAKINYVSYYHKRMLEDSLRNVHNKH